MKRTYFLKYLRNNGCELLREGAKHSWWVNTLNNNRSSVPRHNDIDEHLVKKICKDLGIKQIK